MRNMKISTAQLAKMCGVSQGTVDRALNNRTGISKKTKDMIIDTAVKYGYRPSVGNISSKQIGIIVFNLNNEYLTSLVTETELALRQLGYTATIMFSHYSSEDEIECIKTLYNSGVEGIVLCSVNSGEEFVNFISTLEIPVVCVGNKIEGLPYIGIDDFLAMKEMTEFVINKRYSNIIFFCPALKYSDAYAQKRRFEGFMAGLNGFVNYSIVTDIEQIENKTSVNNAIICSTDYYAIKAYSKGFNADIYGFDNIKSLREYNLPIKSVDYSVKTIAQHAISSLLNKNSRDVIIRHNI